MRFIGAHLVKETLYYAREKVVILVESGENPEQVLIGEQAFLEALVEELIVRLHDLVDSLHTLQLFLQLQEIRLQNLNCHVVYVVLAEMQHFVTQCESVLLDA
jgi:hypothetical protein